MPEHPKPKGNYTEEHLRALARKKGVSDAKLSALLIAHGKGEVSIMRGQVHGVFRDEGVTAHLTEFTTDMENRSRFQDTPVAKHIPTIQKLFGKENVQLWGGFSDPMRELKAR